MGRRLIYNKRRWPIVLSILNVSLQKAENDGINHATDKIFGEILERIKMLSKAMGDESD